MIDPYEAAENVTTDDTTHAEHVPTSDGASSAQKHVAPPAVVGEATSTSSTAVTVPVVEIPLPEFTMGANLGSGSGASPPELSPKERLKASLSEPINPLAVQPPLKVEAERLQTPSKPKAKSVSMRKPPTPKETPEQKAERERGRKGS